MAILQALNLPLPYSCKTMVKILLPQDSRLGRDTSKKTNLKSTERVGRLDVMSSMGGTPSKGQLSIDEHAELRAKALMLQSAIRAKLKHQSDLFDKLVVDAEPKLAQMAEAADCFC